MEAAFHALRDSMVQGDSTTIEVARRDNLVIAASPKLRRSAADALNRFAQARIRWFGPAMPSPGGFRIVVRTEPGQDYFGNETVGDVGEVILAGLPDTDPATRTQRTRPSNELSAVLLDRFGEMMYASAPPALLLWLENAPPLSTPVDERRDIAMYAFVTGMGRIQRNCVGGDLNACALALLVRHAPTTDAGPVFTPFMRNDLLLVTLELGGAGAWNRLRDALGGGVEPALAAAAGMPFDSVIATWRRGLLSRRPTATLVTGRIVLIAVAWGAILFAGMLGATRWA